MLTCVWYDNSRVFPNNQYHYYYVSFLTGNVNCRIIDIIYLETWYQLLMNIILTLQYILTYFLIFKDIHIAVNLIIIATLSQNMI